MLHLGNLYMTTGIQQLIEDKMLTYEDVVECALKHKKGDYGTVGQDSYEINAETIKNNFGTVMSQYKFPLFKIWIISTLSHEETTTCIMLPEEY